MIKIKFIQFYTKLNKRDKREFKKFISSGFVNKGRDFSVFLGAIEKKTSLAANSAEMIKSLTEELSYTSRSVWNRLSELMTMAEQYIVFKETYRNELLFNNLVSLYLINNFEYDLFIQKVNHTSKKFGKTKKGQDSNYYYYQFLQQLGNYYIFQNKNEPFLTNLKEQVIYHNASYINNHYLHLTELLQQGNLTAKELSEKGLNFLTDSNTETFISTLKENYNELYCQVSFHYNIYKAFLLKTDELYYKRALQYFEQLTDTADDAYRSMFYQLLINYCILRTNNNEPEYYKELFRLYNRKLDEGFINDLKVGNFPINNFRDYIFVAIQLGKFDWIKWFIENYSSYLPTNIRNDEINLSYGIVHYNESKYSEAVIFLNKVAGENYIHYMDSKYYRMRIFYETEKFEEALMEIDSYKHYLRAHKEIPDSFIKPYKVFIKEYSILLNAVLKNKIENAEILYSQLCKTNLSPRRKWIYNKLMLLLKN
ncbi:MAG TPA: hypothetical protein PKE39_06645 [Ignavibacteria bacterium]|nr:hypothetical protein [Ignavibacteria bacterium]HMQ98687.1 hypothetical protein [Ignavibacteria bacterium]